MTSLKTFQAMNFSNLVLKNERPQLKFLNLFKHKESSKQKDIRMSLLRQLQIDRKASCIKYQATNKITTIQSLTITQQQVSVGKTFMETAVHTSMLALITILEVLKVVKLVQDNFKRYMVLF